MALDTSYGGNGLGYNREPGYPKSVRRLEGRGSLAQIRTIHTDRFKVMMTSEDDIADIIFRALPFKVGQSFLNPNGNTDEPTLLTEMTLIRDPKCRKLWYLDQTYEEGVAEETPSDGQGNITAPDQLLPEWSWSVETIDREWYKDAFGDVMQTSAGEKITLAMPFAMPVLTIERYEAWFDSGVIVNFVNHINAAPFMGGDVFQVLCAGIEDRKDTHVVYGNQFFRKVRYVFKFAVPWVPEVLEGHLDILVDHGTYYIDGNGERVHFKAGGSDSTGNLNGSGGALADGAAPVLGRFSRFPLADFNDLGFGFWV